MNIHQFDQAQAGLRDMAELMAEYKKQLKSQGFSKFEVITLVGGFPTKSIPIK